MSGGPRRLLARLCTACAACTAALAGAGATAAAAPGPRAITGGAAALTTNSAIVTGGIDPAGFALSYEFQYGTSAAYTQATPAVSLPARTAPVIVSAPLAKLRPGTRYHYRLVVAIGFPSAYYYNPRLLFTGDDASLSTKPIGRLALLSRRLEFTRGQVAVPVRCASSVRCRGRLGLTWKVTVSGRRLVQAIGSRACSVAAGRRATLRFGIIRRARRRLAAGSIRALAAAQLSSGQRGFMQAVTLAG